MVEDLDNLGAEASGELAAAAERVFAGDASLLVRGRPEREVRLAEQAVMGDDTVARREDVGQVRAHLAVDGNRSLWPERGPGRGREFTVRSYTDDNENHVEGAPDGRTVRDRSLDMQPAGLAGLAAADALDCCAREHLDTVGDELGVDELAELDIDGREHFGQLLHLGHRESSRGERFGHLEPDVAGSDDERRRG